MLSHLYYSIYFLSFDSLQCLADEEWGDRVTIVSCDMRDWDAPEKADILVSELIDYLEIINFHQDGAQKFLKGAHTHLIILVNNLES